MSEEQPKHELEDLQKSKAQERESVDRKAISSQVQKYGLYGRGIFSPTNHVGDTAIMSNNLFESEKTKM